VIREHPGIPAARVGYIVRRQWVLDINTVDHLPVRCSGRPDSWHWVLGDDEGPRWSATVDAVGTGAAMRARLAAYEAAAQIGQSLEGAVTPVHTRDARIGVEVLPGLLLSVTPYVEGPPYGDGTLREDADRCALATMLGELHRHRRPRSLPRWHPGVGQPGGTAREDLLRCLAADRWVDGPWSGPAGRLVTEARPVLERALRQLDLLGAAVCGAADRWVVSHGEPHARNLLRTPDGPRLLAWSSLALAPRERDLGEVLARAEGNDPWFAYIESGGVADPLSPDTLHVFALQRHLSSVAENAVRLSRRHGDTEDEAHRFTDLERHLPALVAVLDAVE
jgi:spectinomycin phosphotransferase